MVTPELVDPLDPHEVPPCGPGTRTVAPNDWELYMKGHIEVPKCCPSCDGDGCAQCGSRAAGETTLVDPSGPAMPGMILQPEPATPEAAPSTAPRVEPPQTGSGDGVSPRPCQILTIKPARKFRILRTNWTPRNRCRALRAKWDTKW